MRASGFRLLARALAALTTISAAAPSEIDEELAAVTVPSLLNAGFSVGNLRDVARERRFVLRDDALALAILHGDGGDLAPRSSRFSTAVSARRTDSAANSSCWSRVKPYFFEVASAK